VSCTCAGLHITLQPELTGGLNLVSDDLVLKKVRAMSRRTSCDLFGWVLDSVRISTWHLVKIFIIL
jgi:hypothetical protein